MLIYASVLLRPDIAFAIAQLCKYMSCPTATHWRKLKHVYRYIAGTLDRGLVLGGKGEYKLHGYADASFACDPDTRRSVTGYVWFYGPGAAVAWSSKTQKTVANSTVEAEFVAANEGAREGMYLRNLLSELGYSADGPMTLYDDSTGAIFAAKKPVHTSRTKHMDIRYHYVRELIAMGYLEIEYMPTDKQLADGLTKPLGTDQFRALMDVVHGTATTEE